MLAIKLACKRFYNIIYDTGEASATFLKNFYILLDILRCFYILEIHSMVQCCKYAMER